MPNYNITDEQRYYRSLKRNMIIAIIFVSVMPLILISGITRHYFQVSYREKAQNHLKAIVTCHRHDIDGFFNDRLTSLRVLARTLTLRQLTDETALKEALLVLQTEHDRSLVDLGMVDDHGKQVAYVGSYPLRGADYSREDWFREAMNAETYVSDVLHGMRGLPHFIVALRVKFQEKWWIFKTTVSCDAVNSLVEGARTGKTGFAFIVNRRGAVQTSVPSGFVPDKEFYVKFLSSSPDQTGDTVTVVEGPDEAGEDVIRFLCKLKHGGWLLAFRQSVDEAYSALFSARRLAVATFLFGVVGIVIGAVALSNRTVKRIAQADRDKQVMNEQLIEAGKLASLGELAAGIAHEINNPVAVMVEEAGWIRDIVEDEDLTKPDTVDELKHCLSKIQTQGRRCKDITHKLLSFARKTDHTLKQVQLNELVEEVVALSDQRAFHNNVKIVKSLQEDLPMVYVSPSEIQQVLLNLINNSLDEMDTKGGTIHITSKLSGEFVLLDIADTGKGIPEAVLPRIFDPFFTTKPVGKGTGLGLSICYGIIKKMGGEITVTSAEGNGTTFHVHIPLSGDGATAST